MNQEIILLIIIIACLIFIGICLVKGKTDYVIDFGIRSIIGMAAIYFLNFLLGLAGSNIVVGINGITVLTSGLLGIPGIIMLYGLALYYSL